jgi:hypothetical protein
MRKWLSATLIVIALCAGLALGAQKKNHSVPRAPSLMEHYSPGILLDGTLYSFRPGLVRTRTEKFRPNSKLK